MDKTVCLWDVATGIEKVKLEGQCHIVTSVSFSPDSLSLAAGMECVRVWDLTTGKEKVNIKSHYHYVTSGRLVLMVTPSPPLQLTRQCVYGKWPRVN